MEDIFVFFPYQMQVLALRSRNLAIAPFLDLSILLPKSGFTSLRYTKWNEL